MKNLQLPLPLLLLLTGVALLIAPTMSSTCTGPYYKRMNNGLKVTPDNVSASKVTGLGCSVPKSYAGFLTVDTYVGNHLFFWYFPSPDNEKAPLVVWLGDRIGQSAMASLFWHNGPIMVNKTSRGFSPRPKAQSLVGRFSVVYVDNPVGTGYSYSDHGEGGYRKNTSDGAYDLAEFIQQFVHLFPASRDIYVGGQGYAGRYVMAVGKILQQRALESVLEFNLKGVVIGSPFFYTADVIERYFEQLSADIIQSVAASVWKDVYNNLAKKDNYSNPYFDFDVIMESGFMRNALHVGDSEYHALNHQIKDNLLDFRKQQAPEILSYVLTNVKHVLVYNSNTAYGNASDTTTAFDKAIRAFLSGNATTKATKKSALPKKDPLVLEEKWSYNNYGTHALAGYYTTGSKSRLCRVSVLGRGAIVKERFVEMMMKFNKRGCVYDE